MKKSVYLILLVFALFQLNVNGQQFEFTLHFEDAMGNKDSVILGYDDLATHNVDTMFGEMDISDHPYDSVFEVRGAAYQYPLECNHLNNRDQLLFESKKLITQNTCDFGASFEGESAMVTIKSKYPPVKITWDSTLFNSTCINSCLVDWMPGGWFDACCCNGAWGPFLLSSTSSYEFSSTDFQFFTETDTVLTLFFPLSNKNIVGIQELDHEENEIKVYPNPMTGKGVVEFNNRERNNYSFKIYDSSGKLMIWMKDIVEDRIEFQLKDCNNGVYCYELLNMQDNKEYSGKFVYKRN